GNHPRGEAVQRLPDQREGIPALVASRARRCRPKTASPADRRRTPTGRAPRPARAARGPPAPRLAARAGWPGALAWPQTGRDRGPTAAVPTTGPRRTTTLPGWRTRRGPTKKGRPGQVARRRIAAAAAAPA